MSDNADPPQAKPERWKIALIPFLAVTLAWLVWPSTDASPIVELAVQDPQTDDAVAGNQHGRFAQSKSQVVWQKNWPDVPLAETIEHNPFAMPRKLLKLSNSLMDEETTEQQIQNSELQAEELRQQQKMKQLQERIASIRQTQISAVLIDDRGRSAIIGSKVLREGDLLEDGVRIVTITSDGITVCIEE